MSSFGRAFKLFSLLVTESAMNGIRTGDDSPISDQIEAIKVLGNEGFHPTSLGHSLMASSIIKATGNISSFEYCSGGQIICPTNSEAPDPTNYWIPDVYHTYTYQQLADFVQANNEDNLQKQITLGDGSFMPSSSVTAEVTSVPRSLGEFTVNNDGGLSASINLPMDLEEGFHTIHLYGTTYSGEAIELYQTISYFKPKILHPSRDEVNVVDLEKTEDSKTIKIAESSSNQNQIADAGSLGDVITPEVKGSSIGNKVNNGNCQGALQQWLLILSIGSVVIWIISLLVGHIRDKITS